MWELFVTRLKQSSTSRIALTKEGSPERPTANNL